MAKPKAKREEEDLVRIAFRLHGRELAQIREVRDLMNLNSELDACRYLMQRGVEAISGALGNRRLSERMTISMTPEHIVGAMAKVLGGGNLDKALIDMQEERK